MRVVGYLRVSTDGQTGEDRFGLDSQRESIEVFCGKKGYEIVAWYVDEGISGAKEDRPEFNRILQGDIPSGVEAVVVAKSDRVARDVYIYFAYKNELRKKGLQIISVAEDFGELGAYSVILDAMLAAIAEVERMNINARTSGGRKQKASKGGYSGGKVPYGYRSEGHNLVIDPEEARVVREVYEYRDKGYSYRSIISLLEQEGSVPRSGGQFNVSTIHSILSNENTYRGLYRYGGSEWVKGEQEAII